MTFTCHHCGQSFKHYETAQRHADTHGGGRIEIVNGEKE